MSELTESPIDQNPPPLQFSLRSILIVQAVVAAFLGALLLAGVFAVLAAFVATLIFAAVRARPQRLASKRMIVDLMGGVVLPCLCLWYDPFVFRGNTGGVVPAALAAVPLAIVLQIVVLAFWLVAGPWLGRFAATVAGVLWCGVIMAGLLGIVLLPMSLLGTLLAAGVGLLGFVPFLTAVVFARNAVRATRQARRTLPQRLGVWVVIGALLAVAAAMLISRTIGPALGDMLRALPQPLPIPPFD
ncbi:MAG: hypothetical protein HQ567_34520 [Candidatus Nealsonbacteria bacterium]|nr:hypothetical protein [Candidatus Nealsonbacteria bacterium]